MAKLGSEWEEIPAAPGGDWEEIPLEAATPQVLEEQHPSVTTADRLILQNTLTPEKGAEYLKAKYPELEVKMDRGRALIKAPGDKAYRVVDPQTGLFSKDILNDVGDVAFDLGAGVAEGAATAAGATAGGLPGAMAAGAASGAGTEYLRQKLGEYFAGKQGVTQEPNLTDVGVAGAVGGLFPGLGAAAKGVSGALGKRITPFIGEKISGVPREAIQTLKRKFGMIDELEKTGVTPYVDELTTKTKTGLGAAKAQVGQMQEQLERGVKENIDIRGLKGNIKTLIQETEAEVAQNPTVRNQQALQELKDTYERYFMQEVKTPAQEGLEGKAKRVLVEGPDSLTPDAARTLRSQLKEISESYKVGGGTQSRFNGADTVLQKRLAEVARQGERDIQKQFSDLTGGETRELRKKYADITRLQKQLNRITKSEEGMYGAMSNLRGNPILKERLEKVAREYGVNLIPDAQVLEAYKYFARPASAALSSFGTTSTSRTIPLAVLGGSLGTLGGYNEIGGYSGAAIGGGLGAAGGAFLGSPQMLKYYVKQGIKARELGRKYAPAAYGAGQGIWSTLYQRGEKE